MCIKHIAKFGNCGHVSEYIETENCHVKTCEDPREQEEYYESQTCLACVGDGPQRPRYKGLTLYYKHCYISLICDHEYGHAFTDAERDPLEKDYVLVTPVLYELCPRCEEGGYDRRAGGTNPPPKIASTIPQDFRDLVRRQSSTIAHRRPQDDLGQDTESPSMTSKLRRQIPNMPRLSGSRHSAGSPSPPAPNVRPTPTRPTFFQGLRPRSTDPGTSQSISEEQSPRGRTAHSGLSSMMSGGIIGPGMSSTPKPSKDSNRRQR